MKSSTKKLIFVAILFNCGLSFATTKASTFSEYTKKTDLYDKKTGIEQVDYLVDEYSIGAFRSKELFHSFNDDEFHKFVLNKRELYLQNDHIKNAQALVQLETACAKLNENASRFFKHAANCRVTEYLREICKIEFTKEEKETMCFFDLIAAKESHEFKSPLESKLAYLFLESSYFKQRKNSLSPGKIASIDFASEDLDFFISFHILQQMVKLFDEEEFDPILFQHVETYGRVIKKEFVKTHSFLVMEDFANGKIHACSDLEKLARSFIKPYMNKYARIASAL
ncbi:hypothetical protein COB11_03800 [Candidatus Aerophobetes bacterium]|uniref:Uncharacterized protein n=1 Tax=Aerophobetes bacterium TaxID=2030807 RepID=A0A2A4YIF6_UNCAE|nr:MAG: hypothetical protein COB11_03800 [Candidatus Aerophobetes bacterium]